MTEHESEVKAGTEGGLEGGLVRGLKGGLVRGLEEGLVSIVDGEEAVEFEGEVDSVGKDDIEADKGADIKIGLFVEIGSILSSPIVL